MSEVAIKYKGSDIATMDASGTKTLLTSGKYCEADIAVEYTRPTPNLQNKSVTYTPTGSTQTDSVSSDSGYDGLDTVSVTVNAMPIGTAGAPTASKGAVSNHGVAVTPSVTNTTGYITGGTIQGSAVAVTANELVSGTLSITSNGTKDVTNYASVNVNVTSSGKNAQAYSGIGVASTTSYTATGVSLTVAKTGTYHVYWTGYRANTSGTWGSRLYVNGTATGTAQTTFSQYANLQTVHLTNISLTANDEIVVRARSRASGNNMYIMDLFILEA